MNSLIKTLTLNNFRKLILYSLFGIFNNIWWVTISLINIFKAIPKSYNYKMFSYENALLYYFYDIKAFCLMRKGRYKYSEFISYNPFLIGRWFHISKISLYPFYKNSILTVFISWIIILIYPFLSELSQIEIKNLTVLVLTAFSSKYFYQLKSQNYNIIGWVFLYPFLEALSINNIVLISILSVILFELSLTVFVIGSFFLVSSFFFYKIPLHNIFINFLAVSPFIFLRVFPLIKTGLIKDQTRKILIAIGFLKHDKSNLKRKSKTLKQIIFDLFNLFVLLLFATLFLLEGKFPIFLILSIIVYVINNFVARFADPESIDICILICSIFSLFNVINTPYLIIFYWLFICNPIFEGLFEDKFGGKIDKALSPVKINHLKEGLDNFFLNLKGNKKIFFPCKDPKSNYDNILDNHNILLNPIAYFALKNNILFFPYYFSVFDDFKSSSLKYWGVTSKDIVSNMKIGEFNYALIKSEKSLNEDLGFKKNFKIISKLDWRKIYPHKIKEIDDNPVWHLLKLK